MFCFLFSDKQLPDFFLNVLLQLHFERICFRETFVGITTIKNICIRVKACRPGKNLAGKNKKLMVTLVQRILNPNQTFCSVCYRLTWFATREPHENHSGRRYNNTIKRSWVQIPAVLPSTVQTDFLGYL